MAKPGHTGIRRLIFALGYSIKGLSAAWRHESAFRQELALLVLAIPFALWLARDPLQLALLVASLLLVLVVELMNSAIEAAVDRVGDDDHPLSARAKDLGSAAVLVTLVLGAVVWGAILRENMG